MDPEFVKKYFDQPRVVADYLEAAENVGLWESEKIVFGKYISRASRILELGCGAGRIALGMWEMGYSDITATDFSPLMVGAAAALAERRGAKISVLEADARSLPFGDSSFDSVVFGFNGFMQIPSRAGRRKAAAEVRRVLRGGGIFIFTAHDRDNPGHRSYWDSERKQWASGSQNPLLDEFGDIVYGGEHGRVFIHSPDEREILEDIGGAGLSLAFRARRSDIADEPESVLKFSDDCFFYAFYKNEQKVR